MVLLVLLKKKKEKRRQLLMAVNKLKKSNRIGALVIVLTIGIVVVAVTASVSFPAATVTTPTTTIIQSAEAFVDPNMRTEPKAPMAASQDGNNVYVVWWTNRSGNWEVMFRASNDGGQTFGDRINLSNSPDTQSQTAEILAVGNSVFVSWWELNENVHPHTNESVMRVSTDAGQTFGPVINLGSNGTISTTTSGNNTTDGTAAGGEGGNEEG
jgi:hypothetical protein